VSSSSEASCALLSACRSICCVGSAAMARRTMATASSGPWRIHLRASRPPSWSVRARCCSLSETLLGRELCLRKSRPADVGLLSRAPAAKAKDENHQEHEERGGTGGYRPAGGCPREALAVPLPRVARALALRLLLRRVPRFGLRCSAAPETDLFVRPHPPITMTLTTSKCDIASRGPATPPITRRL
jgi:hypothetical protein